jgi:F-type H+-transporting ATPase subunit b
MTSRSKRNRSWNFVAWLVTLVALIGYAPRVKNFFLHAQNEPAAQAPASSASEPGSPAPESKPAEPKQGETSSEASSKSGESKEKPPGKYDEAFTWINFLIIVAAFFYLSRKWLGPYLQSRGEAIREDMASSKRAIEAADARMAAVEQKLKALDSEIGSLKSSALEEAAGERARIEERAKADGQKIAAAAEQEIAAAAKVARQELKVYAAELAIDLAEKKIQSSISPDSERIIFRSFIDDFGKPGSDGKSRKGGS